MKPYTACVKPHGESSAFLTPINHTSTARDIRGEGIALCSGDDPEDWAFQKSSILDQHKM